MLDEPRDLGVSHGGDPVLPTPCLLLDYQKRDVVGLLHIAVLQLSHLLGVVSPEAGSALLKFFLVYIQLHLRRIV